MTALWSLPSSALIGGVRYSHRTDFRVMLKLLSCLADPSRPELLRWYIALELFYEEPIPREHVAEAMEYLSGFLRCGAKETPGPKLFDWQHDAAVIIAEVNKAAGFEVREREHVHWWTFLSYFHAIGQGQLASLVALREKIARGRKLEPYERDYYRAHKAQVDLPREESDHDRAEKQRLLDLLDRKPNALSRGEGAPGGGG